MTSFYQQVEAADKPSSDSVGIGTKPDDKMAAVKMTTDVTVNSDEKKFEAKPSNYAGDNDDDDDSEVD